MTTHSQIIENKWRDFLVDYGAIDSYAKVEDRLRVVNFLKSLLPSFIDQCIEENNPKRASDVTGQLIPFGSYGLGGYINGADMDLVMLGPVYVRRRDFLNIFPNLLRTQPTVNSVEVIRNASVPIIKCKVDSFEIDISYVQWTKPSVPPRLDLLNNAVLEGMEQTCLASMDGPRVCQYILQQVHEHDLSSFRLCLQTIKFWAKKRNIYNKPMGFLNGSAWTLLLLKTYLMMQTMSMDQSPIPQSLDTSSATRAPPHIGFFDLLRSFFITWSEWRWPVPVLFSNPPPVLNNQVPVRFEYMSEFRDQLMPIVTPCYPVSSAAPNVTPSTLAVVREELRRAAKITHQRFMHLSLQIEKLIKPASLLTSYLHFIQVTISCETIKSHCTWMWKMPYRMPRLVQLLESAESVQIAHPLTSAYTTHVSYNTSYNKLRIQKGLLKDDNDSALVRYPGALHVMYMFVGIQLTEDAKASKGIVDLTEPLEVFQVELASSSHASKDQDVKINLSAANRRSVDYIMKEYSQIK
ncbi:PAP/OAS1 substrate-binding domain-containing protein [Hesseltinella vesiculosa]|uniref:polynucleotide adenylyltransferase n=1 Tax=Hesseltinella vesiculosa TaxID=101127 RepID=A0A1X2GXH8_9FUNG|nr:PAP/OAS1 substrate-binding domain-containing protein [Hesseltinella vesiculosa]